VLADHLRATGEGADDVDESPPGSEDGEIGEDEVMMEQGGTATAFGEQSAPAPKVLHQSEKADGRESIEPAAEAPGIVGKTSIPQAMIEASTQDEGLKNLMMSWYWAGYYSGYYEGQRQATAGQTNGPG